METPQITPQEAPTNTQPMPPTNYGQPQPNDNLTQTIMPTKNPASIVSYYCGVFGIIPFLGLPLTIIAIIFGHKALAQWRKQPTPGAKGHALTGLIFGYFELLVFVAFIILMVVARSKSQN